MRNKLFMAGVLTAATLCVGCVDERYDLNDLDMTIGVNTNLTLPSSSTGEIILRNIMNLQEDGVVRIVPNPAGGEDIFAVKQSGTADIDPIHIKEIRVNRPTNTGFDVEADLSSIKSKPTASMRKLKAVVGGKEHDIPDQTYFYEVEPGKASSNINGALAQNISKDIVSIERVRCDEVAVTLRLKTQGFPSYIPYLHLDDMTLHLPEELEVLSCKINGEDDAISIEPGVIRLTQTDKARNSDELTLLLTFSEAHSGPNFIFDTDKRTAELTGTFEIRGVIRAETSEMKQEQMEAIINEEIKTWDIEKLQKFEETNDLTMVDGLIPGSIHFSGNADFDKDIVVTHVTGEIKHEIDKVEAIKLGDLPDFLNDDEVVLDLDNPMIFLRATSELPATATTSITLSSSTDAEKHTAADLVMQGNGKTTKYYLANRAEDRYLPKEDADAEFVEVKNLGNLIRVIPKEVKVEIAPVVLRLEDADVRKEYKVDVSYDVFAPLAFGNQFKMVFQDSECDWDLDEDLEKLDAELITATALCTSELPAKLLFTLIPIDAEGKEIKDLTVNAATVEANADKQPVSFTIKPTEGHTLNDALAGKHGVKKLDGILYKAVISDPIDASALPAKSNIKLTDIKINISGMVTYDAN